MINIGRIYTLFFLLQVVTSTVFSQSFLIENSVKIEEELKDDVFNYLLENKCKTYPVFKTTFIESASDSILKRELLHTRAIPVVDFSKDAINYEYGDKIIKYLTQAPIDKRTIFYMARAAVIHYNEKLVGLVVQFKKEPNDSEDWRFWKNDAGLSYTSKVYENLIKSIQFDDQLVYCRPFSKFGIIREERLLIFNEFMKLISAGEYIKENYSSRSEFRNFIEMVHKFDPIKYKRQEDKVHHDYLYGMLVETIYRTDTLRNSLKIDDYYSSFRTYAFNSIDDSLDIIKKGIVFEIKKSIPSLPDDVLNKSQVEYIKYFRNCSVLEGVFDKYKNEQCEASFLSEMYLILGDTLFANWKKVFLEENNYWYNTNLKISNIKSGNKLISKLKKELGYEKVSNINIILDYNGPHSKIIKEYFTERSAIYGIPVNESVENREK